MNIIIDNSKNIEPIHIEEVIPQIIEQIEVVSSGKSIIESNTFASSLNEIKEEHIIPVFIKDNEPVISHGEFIETTLNAIKETFKGEVVLSPNIRLSHPIKGRVPEARNKPANELMEHEKTLYFERMAFVIEVPSIFTEVGGNRLNLTVGGVKAYNQDNLYNRLGADQHFKVFIGFKNLVCTNLCVSTDGYLSHLKVKSVEQLNMAIRTLISDYNAISFADQLRLLQNYDLSEKQFANFIGRCKLYKYLPESERQAINELNFGDSQLNTVCKDYYADVSFCSNPDGSINLWKLYNLFTGASKSSYIDSFLDRNVNAFNLINDIRNGLDNPETCWYLN